MSIQLDAEAPPLERDADGVIRVAGTRITLDTVVEAYLQGTTADGIVEQYPSLAAADVYSAIGFYLRHRAQVESYLNDRRAKAQQVRLENERRADPAGVRGRLLARRKHP
jgi:uncharacterized protein (DUF433 family)